MWNGHSLPVWHTLKNILIFVATLISKSFLHPKVSPDCEISWSINKHLSSVKGRDKSSQGSSLRFILLLHFVYTEIWSRKSAQWRSCALTYIYLLNMRTVQAFNIYKAIWNEPMIQNGTNQFYWRLEGSDANNSDIIFCKYRTLRG